MLTVWHQQLESVDPACHVSTGHAECSIIKICGFFPPWRFRVLMAAVYYLLMTTFKCLPCLTGFRNITVSAVDFSGLPITSQNPVKFPSILMYWCAAKNLAVQECQHGLISQRNVFSIQWNPLDAEKMLGCLTTNRGPEQHWSGVSYDVFIQ